MRGQGSRELCPLALEGGGEEFGDTAMGIADERMVNAACFASSLVEMFDAGRWVSKAIVAMRRRSLPVSFWLTVFDKVCSWISISIMCGIIRTNRRFLYLGHPGAFARVQICLVPIKKKPRPSSQRDRIRTTCSPMSKPSDAITGALTPSGWQNSWTRKAMLSRCLQDIRIKGQRYPTARKPV